MFFSHDGFRSDGNPGQMKIPRHQLYLRKQEASNPTGQSWREPWFRIETERHKQLQQLESEDQKITHTQPNHIFTNQAATQGRKKVCLYYVHFFLCLWRRWFFEFYSCVKMTLPWINSVAHQKKSFFGTAFIFFYRGLLNCM